MKKILLIILIASSNLAKCQMTSNIISETEFNNIKINGITLNDIKSTNGIYSQINNLIPASIEQSVIESEEAYFYYVYDGFDISFSENEISSFEISKSNWSILIQGKTLTIGSNIDVLGNVVLNTNRDGSKSIIYQYCDGCNNYITIDFDTNTNLITAITYIEMT